MQAKFYVASISNYSDPASGVRVELLPVNDGSQEAKDFWAGTPNGRIEIYANLNLKNLFEINEKFEVFFSPVA